MIVGEDDNVTVDVYIKRLNRKNPLPAYKSEQASGMDIYANLPDGVEITIGPGEVEIIPGGISTVIPDGFEFQVRSRSGLSAKNKIFVLNGPGTIDADFRNEYGVILANFSRRPFVIKNGDRIAQIVLQVVPKVRWIEVDRLEDVSLINRGGGFGSTGI